MGVLTKHLREHREAMRQEQKAGDAKNPAFWRCRTHGPAKAGAWGCPECVSEMRRELEDLREQRQRLYALAFDLWRDEVLSEQQCARYLGTDLVTTRFVFASEEARRAGNTPNASYTAGT